MLEKRDMNEGLIRINSKDFWVNIVDFLQQYWALIEQDSDSGNVTVFFIHEGSGIFANMKFESIEIAEKALMQNGFKKYTDPYENYREFMKPPKEPYFMVDYNNGNSMAS